MIFTPSFITNIAKGFDPVEERFVKVRVHHHNVPAGTVPNLDSLDGDDDPFLAVDDPLMSEGCG